MIFIFTFTVHTSDEQFLSWGRTTKVLGIIHKRFIKNFECRYEYLKKSLDQKKKKIVEVPTYTYVETYFQQTQD